MFTHLLCTESVLACVEVPLQRLLRRRLLHDLCRSLLGSMSRRLAPFELAPPCVQICLCLSAWRGTDCQLVFMDTDKSVSVS